MNRLIVLAAALAVGTPAAAQSTPQCGPYDAVKAVLLDKYEEVRIGRGITARGMMMELYVSPEGEWSIIETTPKGRSCLRSDGFNWDGVAPPLPGEPT